MLGVIEGFKAMLTKEATPLIEVPDDEVRQPSEVVEDMMDEDEGRQQWMDSPTRLFFGSSVGISL